jgi:hypothetical protein
MGNLSEEIAIVTLPKDSYNNFAAAATAAAADDDDKRLVIG